jgi:hypothetical protein
MTSPPWADKRDLAALLLPRVPVRDDLARRLVRASRDDDDILETAFELRRFTRARLANCPQKMRN